MNPTPKPYLPRDATMILFAQRHELRISSEADARATQEQDSHSWWDFGCSCRTRGSWRGIYAGPGCRLNVEFKVSREDVDTQPAAALSQNDRLITHPPERGGYFFVKAPLGPFVIPTIHAVQDIPSQQFKGRGSQDSRAQRQS